MASALDGNRASRDAIHARVRKALGRDASDARAQAEAVAYLAAGPFLLDKTLQPPWKETEDWRHEFQLD